MSKGQIILVILAGLLLAGGYAFYSWYRTQDIALSERPTEDFIPAIIPAEVSQIGIRASASYATLASELSELTKEPFKDSGSGEFKYRSRLVSLTVGYHWDVTVKRNGPITAQQSGDNLLLVVPMRFDGSAGFRGDGAKLLDLDKKNFDGALTAMIHVGFDLDEAWCPVVSVTVDHRWDDKASVEIIGGVDISVSGAADDMLAKLKQDAQKMISDLLPCDEVKKLIAPYWSSYSFPIDEVDGITAHVNAVPQDIAFSGLRATPEGVGLAFRLGTRIAVNPFALTPEVMPLPPLKRADWAPGAIDVSVPLSFSMEEIEALANKEIAGKDYKVETPAGDASVNVGSVEIFQSGTRIAIGLDFKANLPGKVFNTSGEVYLVARPEVNMETQEVYLEEVAFSRVLDNDIWQGLSAVFADWLEDEVKSKLRYDLTDDLTKVRDIAFEKLNDPELVPGLALNAKEPTVTIEGPYLNEGEITVIANLETEVDAQIKDGLLSKGN